jgi:hypothetical protein
MGVCEVLCPTKNPLAFGIDLLVGHPRCIGITRKIMNLLGPLLQQRRFFGSEELPNQQISTLLEIRNLLRRERIVRVLHGRRIAGEEI